MWMIMLRQKKANGDNVSDETKAFYWPTNAYATGHFNWSEYGAIFETAPDCAYVQVMFCFRASGSYTAYVDNVALEEPYIKNLTTMYEGVNFPLMVEQGCIFVLGDNRNNSEDSRSGNIGMVKRNQIEGKAWFHFAHGEDGIGLIH